MTATCASALGREPGFAEYRAVQESLSRVHPRMRASWLRGRGLDDSPYTTFRKPDSGSGLRCLGRWPWGPSWELCGRDSLLFLGSGSGVRILSISDSIHPRQLGQIVARGLVSQLVIKDTLLFVACGNWGAQIYSVSDPANPVELGSVDAVIYDLAVIDTFCYTLGVPSGSSGTDSFRIYSLADPTQPRQLGAVRDSGHTLAVIGGHAYSAGRWTLNVYDVTNPAAPQWVSSLGGSSLALCVRGNMLFRSGVSPSYFSVYDITDPLNISQVGQLSGYGGHALYVDDDYAYLSCTYDREGIFVIDIANPANPQVRGSYNPEGTENYDPYVPTPLSYGYLASDYGGLMVLDLHNPNVVTEAWSGYKADLAVDIDVSQPLAIVANYLSGVQIIDVADATMPTSLALFDTVGVRYTAAAVLADSFAFISMSGIPGRKYMRSLDINDPANPVLVAQESCFNPPEDLVLRDSFLYCAEVNRFQIFNVARPREPVLVGSCAGDGVAIVVQDSFAYTAAGAIRITNVARPDSPFVVATITGHGASGIAVRDTFLYVPYAYDTLFVYSVANPSQPRQLAAVQTGVWPMDVVLGDARAYVALSDGNGVEVFDLTDPGRPVSRGRTSAPYDVRRLAYRDGLLYAAMYEAGVAVYETTATGIAETSGRELRVRGQVAVRPNPTRGVATLRLTNGGKVDIVVRDVTGRLVQRWSAEPDGRGEVRLDLTNQSRGVYFVEVGTGWRNQRVSVVRN